MTDIEQRFMEMHLLDTAGRTELLREIERLKQVKLRPYFPKWWWWRRCKVRVLLVCDGTLGFGTGGFGLSEFLTAFNRLQSTTWNDYELTLGHRQSSVLSANPLVVDQGRIPSRRDIANAIQILLATP